jgi:hypothetical protein
VLEEAAGRDWIGCYGVAAAKGFYGEGAGLHRFDDLLALLKTCPAAIIGSRSSSSR